MTILLVDGNNLAFVSNSIGARSTKTGFPTQAIFNFLRNIRAYIGTFNPDKVFVAWDGGKSKKRLAALPTYKENRAVEKKTSEQKMNFEELLLQLPIIKKAITDLGLYTLHGPGIEGDDLIALMAKKADQMGEEAVIVSSDTDFHQLVNPNISVYGTMVSKKKPRHVTVENFAEVHEGLTPEQYLGFKALQGDSSDDIPGVKGVGPVTARDLVIKFGSPENWRLEVEKGALQPTKTQAKILDGWNDYVMSKSMIDLHEPLADFSTAKIQPPNPDHAAIRQMAIEYQLMEILMDFGAWVQPFKGLN